MSEMSCDFNLCQIDLFKDSLTLFLLPGRTHLLPGNRTVKSSGADEIVLFNYLHKVAAKVAQLDSSRENA